MSPETTAILNQLEDRVQRALVEIARAAVLIERLRHAGDETEEPRDPEAEARWLRGARMELAQLIRDVEGPNPPPAPRRKKL